jgi:YjbE family integral membrane protein
VEFLSAEYWAALVSILVVNIILSVDNAVVIAMASRGLPEKQRKLAMWWGAFGAIFLRIVLTVLVQYLLRIPFLQVTGGALLIWIAIKLLIQEEDHGSIREATSITNAVWTIIVADFIMSLDNVLAIAGAAKGDVSLIIIGLGISIPLIIWGSSMVSQLLIKFPILIYLGAGILAYIAGDMLLHDPMMRQLSLKRMEALDWISPWGIVGFVVVLGFIWKKFIPTKRE